MISHFTLCQTKPPSNEYTALSFGIDLHIPTKLKDGAIKDVAERCMALLNT